MQQPAIPFELTPRSFVITVFIIMIVVSLTQIFAMHALLSLQSKLAATWRKVRRWVERIKGEGAHRAGLNGLDGPRPGAGQGETPTDEERVLPKISTVKPRSRTWMSWMTGTTI
jgi:hypothetical protein